MRQIRISRTTVNEKKRPITWAVVMHFADVAAAQTWAQSKWPNDWQDYNFEDIGPVVPMSTEALLKACKEFGLDLIDEFHIDYENEYRGQGQPLNKAQKIVLADNFRYVKDFLRAGDLPGAIEVLQDVPLSPVTPGWTQAKLDAYIAKINAFLSQL